MGYSKHERSTKITCCTPKNTPTSPQRPPLHTRHFLLSPRWQLWRGSTVFRFFSYQFFVASAAFWPSWSHPMDKFSPLLSLSLELACLRVPALAIFCAYRVAAALISASSVMGGTPCLWRNLLCSFNASCSKEDPPGDKWNYYLKAS